MDGRRLSVSTRGISDRLRSVLAAIDAYQMLAARSEEIAGALFLRNDGSPNVYEANHVRRVATVGDDAPTLLDAIERHYAGRSYRSLRSDARSPTWLEAQLLLAGFEQAGGEILMVLDGDMRGRAADVRIAPLASDADWDGWRRVKNLDARSPWFARIGEEWVAHVRSRQPAVCWFGAFDGGELLGSFSVLVHDGVGYLEDLLVAPDARKRGVATALVAHCAGEARRRGAHTVVLPAAHDDTPKQMYARMGFAPIGTAWSWIRQDGA